MTIEADKRPVGARVATGLLWLASLIALAFAPTVFFLLLWSYPTTWLSELQKYQSIFAASVATFAAGLATIGALLSMSNQRALARRQLNFQQQETDRTHCLEKQQIASALVGEIKIILKELSHELIKPVLKKALHDAENSSSPETPVETVRIAGQLPKFFDSAPGNSGLFPDPIPEELVSFYRSFDEIRLNLDCYANAAEVYKRDRRETMTRSQIIYLLRRIVADIDDCEHSGRAIIVKLEAIRDANVD